MKSLCPPDKTLSDHFLTSSNPGKPGPLSIFDKETFRLIFFENVVCFKSVVLILYSKYIKALSFSIF